MAGTKSPFDSTGRNLKQKDRALRRQWPKRNRNDRIEERDYCGRYSHDDQNESLQNTNYCLFRLEIRLLNKD